MSPAVGDKAPDFNLAKAGGGEIKLFHLIGARAGEGALRVFTADTQRQELIARDARLQIRLRALCASAINLLTRRPS
jgi:hypothetical protein